MRVGVLVLVGGDFSCVNCIREWWVGEFKPKGGRRGRIVEGAVRAARSDRSFRPSQRLYSFCFARSSLASESQSLFCVFSLT